MVQVVRLRRLLLLVRATLVLHRLRASQLGVRLDAAEAAAHAAARAAQGLVAEADTAPVL